MNHFKTEITSACLVEQIGSDPNLDPNKNYNIIEKKLTEAKQEHLQCKKVKFNKHKHKKSLWITKAILRSIKRRDFYIKNLKKRLQILLSMNTGKIMFALILLF